MRALFSLLLGQRAITHDDREAAYYLRVTLIVGLALVTGASLQWGMNLASPWRLAPFAVAYLIGGYRIALDSWKELKNARLSIDFLMGAAAVGAALVGSALEGTILIFLFSLSKALEAYAMGRTRHEIAMLIELAPAEATLADEEGRETGRIPVADLVPGTLILIRPGERIAADGEVRSGRTEVDQSAITGESVPVRRTTGDGVFAGTVNGAGSLVVEVTRQAGETMLAKIIRLVEEAREDRAPAQHFVDRFAHPYTLLVVAGTIVAAMLPPLAFGADWNASFYRAMTLLVVASPCALVISTPSAILSGIANAARNGVLFKGGAYLDLAGTIDAVAFDKTGTLTRGHPRLVEVRKLSDGGGSEIGRPENETDDLLRWAAAVEGPSEHHLARALAEAAYERSLDVPAISDFSSFPGEGVSATVEGIRVWVGNARMASRQSAPLAPSLEPWRIKQTSQGHSVVYVGLDGTTLGAMSFGDTLKPGVAAAVRELKEEGVRKVVVLSGDHPSAVQAIAAEIGADEVRAGLLPNEKVDALRELMSSSRAVAMVGDGVNDAPAMAASSLGIAMGEIGTGVAIETADVVLMSDDIAKVSYAIHLGKRSHRVVRQNVFFSIGWMLFLVATALTVGIPLPLAVVGHEGSTLLVALNGLRLLRGGPARKPDGMVAEPERFPARKVPLNA